MWTWCTEEEWEDEYFDAYYLLQEHGKFGSKQEALSYVMKNNMEDVIVFCVD